MSDSRTSSHLQQLVITELGGQCDFTRSEMLPGQDPESGDPSQILEASISIPATAAIWKTIELLKDAVNAWLAYRTDREIELKCGNHSVRVKGVGDLDEAFEKLKALDKSNDDT